MIGLIIKDFLVFKKRFHLTYRLIGAAVLGLVIILYPAEGGQDVALLLPVMGVAFLTEIVKVEEKSDWRDYLPALPIISREIVLSRYLFCGILLAAFAATSFVICMIASLVGDFTLSSTMPNFLLGVLDAVLLVCLGIPAGYFFKNDMCTGAMIVAIIICAGIRSTGLDTAFFAASSFLAYALLIIGMALLLYLSYRASLGIFRKRRHAKSKVAPND